MPYTPPAQQSPNGSGSASPAISRRSSYSQNLQQQHTHARNNASANSQSPQLPRSANSASYLHRHRRSPSLKDTPAAVQDLILTETPESTPTATSFAAGLGSSVRQSPPPVNDHTIPTGAVISPPDSTQNSSEDDDEDAAKRGRNRSLENLAELQAVIKGLEQRRQGSPSAQEEIGRLKLQLTLPSMDPAGDSPASPNKGASLSRHISHTRSATDSAIVDIDRPVETPDRSADSDSEEGRFQKPPMLRKKSGELVRPALRPPSAKRRPSSMPGTPTYAKNVHFDAHLEHVRTFLQVDRPLAVSANSSPVETYDGDSEFPFEMDRRRDPPWQWEMKLSNFPTHTFDRRQRPACVERVFLSADTKTLIGTVAVRNLAFHKLVVARFTLDYWKTTSEVVAEYSHDVRRTQADDLDRFNFNIKLEDLANLENKTLFFCVRFNVNGQEFWDSNNNMNFQVDFAKKPVPQKGKNGMSGNASKLNGLPRSRPSPPVSGRPRPKSTSFDDFSTGFGSGYTETFNLNDAPIKFRSRPKNVRPTTSPTLNSKTPTQAFGNRYDFADSLTAAMNKQILTQWDGNSGGMDSPQPETPKAPASTPATLTASKPDVSSQSYHELVEKYCFVRSPIP
jgi:Carbohydrate/starch-binding module (family 21)